jgi:hypothetical protein
MMNRPEAIIRLISIRDRVDCAITTVSRKHWRDSEKKVMVELHRREIEAINLAIDALKREMNARIDEEHAKRSDFKPGLPLGDIAWDHFEKTPLKKD